MPTRWRVKGKLVGYYVIQQSRLNCRESFYDQWDWKTMRGWIGSVLWCWTTLCHWFRSCNDEEMGRLKLFVHFYVITWRYVKCTCPSGNNGNWKIVKGERVYTYLIRLLQLHVSFRGEWNSEIFNHWIRSFWRLSTTMFLLHTSFKSETNGKVINRKFVSFCLIEGHSINWQLCTCALNGNVKNPDLFIHGLFKSV